MLLRIVEGNALFQMSRAADKLSKTRGSPQRDGPSRGARVLPLLGQPQELLSPAPAPSVILSRVPIKHPQSPQHGEELRRLPYLLTQLRARSRLVSTSGAAKPLVAIRHAPG